jgi:hypothetical protein
VTKTGKTKLWKNKDRKKQIRIAGRTGGGKNGR